MYINKKKIKVTYYFKEEWQSNINSITIWVIWLRFYSLVDKSNWSTRTINEKELKSLLVEMRNEQSCVSWVLRSRFRLIYFSIIKQVSGSQTDDLCYRIPMREELIERSTTRNRGIPEMNFHRFAVCLFLKSTVAPILIVYYNYNLKSLKWWKTNYTNARWKLYKIFLRIILFRFILTAVLISSSSTNAFVEEVCWPLSVNRFSWWICLDY